MGSTLGISVGHDEPVYIAASKEHPIEVNNVGVHDVFHKGARDVDNGDTKLEAGKSVELTDGAWFITAAAGTELSTRELDSPTFADDVTVQGDVAVGGKLHAEGEAEIDGDLNHDGAKVGFFGVAPAARPNVKPAAEVNAKELCEALEALGLVQ